MKNKVYSFLKKNNLIVNSPIIVAVSGGADSLCLLDVLYKLGFSVILAHVNHHKRVESEVEEQAMRELAKKLEIPFELLEYHYNGEDNFHNDAHHARYDFFTSLCKKYNTEYIATAHHKDDQIETVLMKLTEGSNLYGYGGIAICKDTGEYKIIRPLLCVDKEEIYSYMKENQISWFEDQSNSENDFLRNRIRHNVVPLLKQEYQDVGTKIMEYSIQAHEAFDFIRSLSIQYLEEHDNQIYIDSYQNLNISVQKDILSLLLEKQNIRKNYDIIESMRSILDSSFGNKQIQLAGGAYFVRSYYKAYIAYIENTEKDSLELTLENSVIFQDKYRFFLTKSHNNFLSKHINVCYNDLVFPIQIRTRKEGDSVKLEFGTKKVSRILIDHKVPEILRDSIPIVCNGNGDILWVYDYCKSEVVVKSKYEGNIYLVCEVIQNDEG